VERIDKAARDLKIQIPQSDPPAADLPSDAAREFYLGAGESHDENSWQEEFNSSLADYEETRTSNQRPSRSQAPRLFMLLALILITAAALFFFRSESDHAPTDRFAVGQASIDEASFPAPVEEHQQPASLMASAFDPLPSLTPTRNESIRGNARIFVHTPEHADRPVITQIGKALQAAGYELPDPRIANGRTGGDVRFFFPGDRREANTIKFLVEAELRRRGFPISLQLLERDGRRFQDAAPGKIEVWLPPLPEQSRVNDS
ncbi:MAG TPA: hypothetical protein VMR88_14170, partial [Candidatus Polarisedimenticolaceae bacterium]|nr:hypothetical protein [Candidatus Polarisedimenticolaceae bacterium]